MSAPPEAAPRGRVVRAATVRSPAELAAARQRADREAGLADLLAAAREEGRRAGMEQATSEAQRTERRAADALEALAATVGAQQDREVQATATAVLEMALLVSGWVLRTELSGAGTQLLGRLEEGLAALLPSATTRLSVSPGDLEQVLAWADSRGRLGTEVVADARLEPGDVVVVTDAGRAELTVAAALEAAGEALGLTSAVTTGDHPWSVSTPAGTAGVTAGTATGTAGTATGTAGVTAGTATGTAGTATGTAGTVASPGRAA